MIFWYIYMSLRLAMAKLTFGGGEEDETIFPFAADEQDRKSFFSFKCVGV